ncbi:hypothetical protein VTJ83DRAFT_3711 [Remersonia thermophila]|uniref:Thioredoxin domain-containing protein n=1 Tax=Remersonia thermophila TaxID=72144 RepID=A0ABR4DET9_9PEZI
MATHISSSAEWRQIVGSHTIVVADFYADWCGPCKMIAPVFESLATKHAKPGKIAFCKVNVDTQRDVASQYGVRAMPTFIVLRSGSVVDTIQGANPPALTAAVDKAVKLAGPGGGTAFSGAGHRLGGTPVARPSSSSAPAAAARLPLPRDLASLWRALVAFCGLYFWTLFSIDPYKAAENSPFNLKNPPAPRGQAPGSGRPAARPGFKTLADLGSS